jgi:RNA polymerase sigma-70 factor (ECF subfamily)
LAAESQRQQLEQRHESIWSDFGASLGRLASSYESNAQGREDLLQEIRLAIWVALPRFRNESSMRTFVFRIAHNRALSHVWRRKKTSTADESEEIADARNNPETSAIENASRSHLAEAPADCPFPSGRC